MSGEFIVSDQDKPQKYPQDMVSSEIKCLIDEGFGTSSLLEMYFSKLSAEYEARLLRNPDRLRYMKYCELAANSNLWAQECRNTAQQELRNVIFYEEGEWKIIDGEIADLSLKSAENWERLASSIESEQCSGSAEGEI